MCEEETLWHEMRKNSKCDFFSHSGNLYAISCKKMREYREIAPENDPCGVIIIRLAQCVNDYKIFRFYNVLVFLGHGADF